MKITTLQEAKNRLVKNWAMFNNPELKPEDYNVIIGDLVRETNARDYYPNCYIISALITKKDGSQNDREFEEYAVFKDSGDCRPAIYFE
jgi:hypothetical protein